MNRTSLVAGGSGFVGSHLCGRLLERGDRVICLDNLGSGAADNVSEHLDNQRFAFFPADVRDREDVLGRDVDEIYHLASRASPADFEDHAIEIALSNSRGTANLLELAMKCDAKVFLASTSEVYGNPSEHPQTETYWGNVNPIGPRSAYDESKRFAEALTMAYHRNHNVDVRIARFFNTYGPRMRTNDGRAVPTFIYQALAGAPITVHGKGDQTRSFCYVDDLIDGIIALMESGDANGEVVNLGNPREVTIMELAMAVTEVTESDSHILHLDRPEDDPDRRRPDITKARDLLGWSPEVDLRDGIRRTADYFSPDGSGSFENPRRSDTL